MYIVTKDGTKLFVRDWGKGDAGKTPLLFVASAGTSSDIWSQTIPAFLDAGYRCISFDRRGHGKSDEPSGPWSLDLLADDVATIAQRLELAGATVIGHSLGGAEAIRHVANAPPGQVKKLVLLAPTAPYIGISPQLEALWASWKKDFPAWVRASARPFFDEHTSDAMLDWGVSLLTRVPLHIHLELGRIIAESDTRADLAKLELPTLLLHGAKDVSVPVELGRATSKLMKQCHYIEYPTAAHGLFFTHPEVIRDILAFLRK